MILGVGMGTIFAPAFGTATLNVDRHEAGVASAMVNTSQQVGGSIGTSLLSTLFASSAASYLTFSPPGQWRRGGRHGPRVHHGVLVERRDLRARAGDRHHRLSQPRATVPAGSDAPQGDPSLAAG